MAAIAMACTVAETDRNADQVEEEFREDGGKRGDSGGRRDQHVQPAEYERGGIAVCFAQEDIDATRLRQQRAQLRHRERSADADQAKGVQSPMMTSGFGTSPAIVGGFRKIPPPIVMPTMSATPPASPMTRRRSRSGMPPIYRDAGSNVAVNTPNMKPSPVASGFLNTR